MGWVFLFWLGVSPSSHMQRFCTGRGTLSILGREWSGSCGARSRVRSFVAAGGLGFIWLRAAGSQAGFKWLVRPACLAWSLRCSRPDRVVSPQPVPAPDSRRLAARTGSLPGLAGPHPERVQLTVRGFGGGRAAFCSSSSAPRPPLCAHGHLSSPARPLLPPPLGTAAVLGLRSPSLSTGSGQEAGGSGPSCVPSARLRSRL